MTTSFVTFRTQVKSISKTQVVACMNPGAGSFFINPRLQRWFRHVRDRHAAARFAECDLRHVFEWSFESRGFADEVLALKDSVISAMNLHGEVMQKFRKTAANFHYEFNIRS